MGFLGGFGNFFADPLRTAGSVFPVVAGANLLAGGLDYLSSEADRRSQEAQANEANRISQEQFAQNMAMQREFAQNGIRWRVSDAEAAGLHPLAALGASGASYSPGASVFTSSGAGSSAGNAFRALSAMGQNVSRSVMATSSAFERARELQTLQRGQLENELLAEQIAGAQFENMRHVGPPMPISDTEIFVGRDGKTYTMPSREYQDASAGGRFYNWRWMFENKLMPGPGQNFQIQPRGPGKYLYGR